MDPDDRRARRRSVAIGVASLVGGTLILIVVLLAVDLGDSPTPDTLAATTVPITTTVPDTSPAIDYVPTEPPVTPAKPTTTTTVATITIPLDRRLVVASDSGIVELDGASSNTVFAGSWAVAVTLGDGSVVAQQVWPGYGQMGDTTIYRVANGTESVLVAPTDPTNEWIRLHDIVSLGGNDAVLYSVKSGTGFDEALEELFLVDVVTGVSRSLGVIGGWEDGPSRLSIGGDLVVGETFTQIESAPFIRRVDSTSVDPGTFGLATSYPDCPECPRAFAIDEKGDRVVWVEQDLLVVVDTSTGERVAEVRMTDGLGRDVDSLDIVDSTILVNVYDRDSGVLGRAYVFGFDGTSTRLSVAGSATFAR